MPRRVPCRSRNATRRDTPVDGGREGRGRRGLSLSRQGGLCCGCAARVEAAANALARYGLDRRGTSLHGMCFLRLLSLSCPLPLSIAFCTIPPSHVSVHLLTFRLSLSLSRAILLLLMLSVSNVFAIMSSPNITKLL